MSSRGYKVINVGLNGTSAYVEMTTSSFKGEQSWMWQVLGGMISMASAYEVEPSDIEEMSEKELTSLEVDYNEVPYMSDEELAQVSEIVGKRASTYIVIIHSPIKICSYRLNRATFRAWDKASMIDPLSNLSDSLHTKMNNEIKNSERCS